MKFIESIYTWIAITPLYMISPESFDFEKVRVDTWWHGRQLRAWRWFLHMQLKFRTILFLQLASSRCWLQASAIFLFNLSYFNAQRLSEKYKVYWSHGVFLSLFLIAASFSSSNINQICDMLECKFTVQFDKLNKYFIFSILSDYAKKY